MNRRADLLILGGSGPIGRAIERLAQHDGQDAVSASRRGPVVLDVGDGSAVEAVLRRVEPRTLVYLVNPIGKAPERAAADFEAVLRSAADCGAHRVLFASSAAVYGDRGASPYSEVADRLGDSDYARTKTQSENVLDRSSSALGLSVLSLRIFNVFGAGCAGSLINRLAVGPRPNLLLSAAFVRDYVHVDDVARAFLAAARHPEVTGTMNIGRGVAVDNLQLADAAGPDSFDGSIDDDVYTYSVAAIGRANEDLGWSGVIDPLEALRSHEPF